MRNALHIARRDLRASFQAPLAWLLLAAWTFLVHAVFALTLLRVHGTPGASAPLYVEALWWGALFLTLLAPAVTMNAWAAERSQGSWQLLLTLPVRESDLVLGKFLAGWGMLLVLLAATAAMPATLAFTSAVALPHLAACYVGLALLAAFLAALGTWIGLLVEGPVATYVISFAVIALFWLLGLTGDDGLRGVLSGALGLGPRISGFLAGQLRLGDAAWLLAATGICLSLAHGAVCAPRSAGTVRWWRRLGAAGGRSVLAALVLVALVAAGDRSRIASDWSADHRFTIDPALTRILASQGERSELVGIWADEDDGWATPVADAATRMAAISPKLTWRRLDPLRHRPLLADFAARHGSASAPSLYVVRGERAQRIPLHPGSRRTLQRDVATALAVLNDPQPPQALLSQGHGELRPNGGAEDGADLLLTTLAGAGFRPALRDDAGAPPDPRDLVVIAGPTAPVGSTLLARLEQHLTDGGGLMILADDRTPADLARWLGRHGVVHAAALPRSGRITDLLEANSALLPARHLVSLHQHVAGQETELPHHNLLLRGSEHISSRHAVCEALVSGGLQLVSPFTAALDLVPPDAKGFPQRQPEPLLVTAPGDSWERSRGEPLAIPAGLEKADPRLVATALEFAPAAASAHAGRGGRLLVWGSRQALADGTLGRASFANGQFAAAGAAWLARREAPAAIPPAEVAAFQVLVGDTTLQILLVILVLALPFLGIGAAILTWWDGRK